ncbi:methionyl-tRNA formyltransferase [Patescibacteria group bacterium]|nr:methionyl-tRNA formyltransferase [Patescibacteria group bacterium]
MQNNNLKCIFFGTPDLAVPFLKVLNKNNVSIEAVVTQPDRPAGRHKILTAPPIKLAAQGLDLKTIQVNSLKDSQTLDTIISINADIYIVVAFGLIIPKELLEVPRFGIINFHPSLLPKYRGASPISSPILAGDTTTGMTIMKMTEGLDCGPIINQKNISIDVDETSKTLTNKFMTQGPDWLYQTLLDYSSGKLNIKLQDESKATLTKQMNKSDGHVDWSKEAQLIERMIRAYNPWPGVYTFYNGKRINLIKANVNISLSAPAGQVFQKDGHIYVGTEKGALELQVIKPSSKNDTPVLDFIRGHSDFVGSKLT